MNVTRLALLAREHAYGDHTVVSTGPVPRKATWFNGSSNDAKQTVVVHFDPSTVGPGGLLLRTEGHVRLMWNGKKIINAGLGSASCTTGYTNK